MTPLLRGKRLALCGGLLLACLAGARAANTPFVVTQKGQMFHPGAFTLAVGDTAEFLNDDGDIIHHAYVASRTFSFDSGDQEPGSKTDVVFNVPGTFTVLCAIHPKMRTDITVQK